MNIIIRIFLYVLFILIYEFIIFTSSAYLATHLSPELSDYFWYGTFFAFCNATPLTALIARMKRRKIFYYWIFSYFGIGLWFAIFARNKSISTRKFFHVPTFLYCLVINFLIMFYWDYNDIPKFHVTLFMIFLLNLILNKVFKLKTVF